MARVGEDVLQWSLRAKAPRGVSSQMCLVGLRGTLSSRVRMGILTAQRDRFVCPSLGVGIIS